MPPISVPQSTKPNFWDWSSPASFVRRTEVDGNARYARLAFVANATKESLQKDVLMVTLPCGEGSRFGAFSVVSWPSDGSASNAVIASAQTVHKRRKKPQCVRTDTRRDGPVGKT